MTQSEAMPDVRTAVTVIISGPRHFAEALIPSLGPGARGLNICCSWVINFVGVPTSALRCGGCTGSAFAWYLDLIWGGEARVIAMDRPYDDGCADGVILLGPRVGPLLWATSLCRHRPRSTYARPCKDPCPPAPGPSGLGVFQHVNLFSSPRLKGMASAGGWLLVPLGSGDNAASENN